MQSGALQRLFRHEAAGGIVLMIASALALVLANSPLAGLYDVLLGVKGAVRIGDFGIEKPLLLWVNDGLMAIFFLLVAWKSSASFSRASCLSEAGQYCRRRRRSAGCSFRPCFTSALLGENRVPRPAGRSHQPPTLHSRSASWRYLAAACRVRSSSF
jgi:Na+/H+ antiporter 1